MPTLNYVTVDEFLDVLPEQEQAEATDDNVAPNQDPTVNNDILERTLKYAESRAESYLTGYTLSDVRNETPYALKHTIYVIAAYMLFMRADLAVSDQVQNAYNEVISWLDDVKNGDAKLPEIDEDDADFVGFGDKSNMRYEYFPHSDYIFNEVF